MILAVSHYPSEIEWATYVGLGVIAVLALGGLFAAVFGGRGRR